MSQVIYERHNRKRQKLTLIIGLLLLGGVSTGGWLLLHQKKADNANVRQTQSPVVSSSPQRIRFIAVGDQLPHDTVNKNALQPDGTYNYKPFFSEVRPFFQSADIRFCNQESPSGGRQLGVSAYPTFNAPDEFPKDLSYLGCNLISLANNHANDMHQAGINGTRAAWDQLPKLGVNGVNRNPQEQQQVSYFTVKDVSLAFIAFNYMNNDTNVAPYAVNMLDEQLVAKLVDEARAKAQIVIVSVHWGTEDVPDVDAQQLQWSNFIATHNADIVIGTGPHVLQPLKLLKRADGKNMVVWYSIGNFLSTQLDVAGLVGGLAIMDFEVSGKSLSMLPPKFMPTYMHYEWSEADKSALKLLERKNLKLYPLDKAADALKRSKNNTTVDAQQAYVKQVLGAEDGLQIITSDQY